MHAPIRTFSPLEALWIDVPAGRIEPSVDSYHVLDLHAGHPVHASIRLDGWESRGAQLRGDINVIPAGSTGRWLYQAPASALLLRLAPALFDEVADAMCSKSGGLELRPAIGIRDPHIEHISWMVKDEALAGCPRGRLWLESAAHAIVLRLVRRSDNSLRLPRLPKRAMPQWRLRRVCDYIEGNLDQSLSLRDLAATAGFSVPHFKVLFKQSVGLPVHRYLVERRVERARQMMLRGERSLTDIALDVGFSHQSHLTRCLQRVLGLSPTQVLALYGPAPTNRESRVEYT